MGDVADNWRFSGVHFPLFGNLWGWVVSPNRSRVFLHYDMLWCYERKPFLFVLFRSFSFLFVPFRSFSFLVIISVTSVSVSLVYAEEN